jgi:hypothetical protein
MPALSPIETAALYMRNASPTAFEDFIKELEKLTEKSLDAMLSAPPDAVQLAQGTSRGYRHVLKILKECTVERAKPGAPLAKM